MASKRCYTIIRVNDKTGARINMLRTPVAHGEAVTITKKLISPLPRHLRNVLEERRCPAGKGLGAFHLKDLWPFSKKKAKRRTGDRTVMYIPHGGVYSDKLAGARRRKRRR